MFKPFLDGGLHSGEVGGPETGAAFKSVFNVTVMRGREAENETVCVVMVSPTETADTIVEFFDGTNLFWQIGRDDVWLVGPITSYKTTPFLVRSPDPKTGFPPEFKKGQGAQVAVFGSKSDIKSERVPAFTGPDTDVLHDGAGIFCSIAGNVGIKQSAFDSKFKSVDVFHGFRNFKQADAWNTNFVAAQEPPYDRIANILDSLEAHSFEIVSDTFFPEYMPKA